MSASADTPFLDQLCKAKRTCGLYLFENFLESEKAEELFGVLGGEEFPWNVKPKLYGYSLPQHAYEHNRTAKKHKDSPGLQHLEILCQKIEAEFDGEISDVYCNRFEDPKHHIDWHKDTYGRHIFVLSLGSQRKVQFRNNKTKEVEEVVPRSGDLYFMPLSLNSTHKHRVCAADGEGTGTRLSFVFFFKTPVYATDFKITRKDKVTGMIESFLA